jgi:hypothetical protein
MLPTIHETLGKLLHFFSSEQLACLHPNVDHPAKMLEHAVYRMRVLYPTTLEQATHSAVNEIMMITVLGGCEFQPVP